MRQLPGNGDQNRSKRLEILCVSQFTLYHRLKGNSKTCSRAAVQIFAEAVA
uniref:D-aminoacyl-tRNA deacylase n=1 Tax=Anopheles funestus TaxID=62324 RepID=A0A182R7E8_ANOFN